MAVLTTGRLPVRLTPLVGRETELGEVARALADCRLLTLTGPGGTGKTRLALAVATQLAVGVPDASGVGGQPTDVAWVELAPLADPQLIAPAVAAVLGVPETQETDQVVAIAAHLSARRDAAGGPVLLVLDNCEHLAAASASLAERLLAECPALRISRPAASPSALRASVPGRSRRWTGRTRPCCSRTGPGRWRRRSPSPTPTSRPSPRFAPGSTGCRWRSS